MLIYITCLSDTICFCSRENKIKFGYDSKIVQTMFMELIGKSVKTVDEFC